MIGRLERPSNLTPERLAIEESAPSRILIVAREAARAPELLHAVARRSQAGPCMFTLLVPRPALAFDPADRATSHTETCLSEAVPLLSRAAGRTVIGMLGGDDALATVEDAVTMIGYDEVMIATLPPRERRIPAHRVAGLGVRVSEVLAGRTSISDRPSA